MRIGVTFDPSRLLQKLGVTESKTDRNLNRAVRQAALLIQRESKRNISTGARTGRLYKRRTVVHRASAPGEYPKTDTGRLVSSIAVEYGPLNASVGTDLRYGPDLEHGTAKMEPRPWLVRTLNENSRQVDAILRAAMKDVNQ